MKKIIISSVIIGLILLIGVSTIILAVIPTGFNYTIERPNEIIISYSKTTDLSPEALVYRDRNSEDEKYISNIYSIFCHAFEQKTLTSIFNGEFNKGLEENAIEKSSKSINSNATSVDKITVCFKYFNKHKIKGYEYSYLFFEITNKNERQDNVFAVNKNFDVNSSQYYYNYYYSGKANFSNLFQYIESIV